MMIIMEDDDSDEADDEARGSEEMLSTSWGQLRSSYKGRRPHNIDCTSHSQFSQYSIH